MNELHEWSLVSMSDVSSIQYMCEANLIHNTFRAFVSEPGMFTPLVWLICTYEHRNHAWIRTRVIVRDLQNKVISV